MIKFIDTAFVGGTVYRAGQFGEFDQAIELDLINAGDAVNYLAIALPVEVLSSSAVAASCASTNIDEILASFTIKSGVLGPNSILQIEPLWTFTNSANNKIIKVKVAGVTVYNNTRTTVAREAPLIVLANRNSLQSQVQPYDSNYFTSGTGSPQTYAIDFSVNVTVEITGQRANGSEALKLEYFRALHFAGA
ncbi:MAG: hypothetical protein J0I90_00165 [Nitrosospira sp.]|nr:hypothetical protein [Nitrosospira sp.]